MLKPHAKIFLFLTVGLLLAGLVSAPAFAGKIEGVSVDVANFKDGHDGDNLVDGDTATAWIGGGKSVGPGKWIELTFPAPVKLQSLSIANGNQGKGAFKKYRRVIRGFIKYPDETRQQFTLKPTPGVQKIALKPKTVESLRVVILGVAPSSKDKAIGKAKVAVSEITVFGEMDESAVGAAEEEPVVVEDESAVVREADEQEAEPEPKPEPKIEKVAPIKAEPAKKAAPAEPAETKAEPVEQVSKPAPEAEAPAPKKAAPEKTAPPKAAPKKAVSPKATPKKKAPQKAAAKKPAPKAGKKGATTSLASAPGIAFLRSAAPVPADKQLDIGQISPWLNLELVAQIKRYFGLLTTLHDSYPDVFVSPIRPREKAAFIAFQDELRAEKKFGQHHMAMLEHIGLNFDKPVIGDDTATIRVHGPYRYYVGDKAYEFMVDAEFFLAVENQAWVISGVKAR